MTEVGKVQVPSVESGRRVKELLLCSSKTEEMEKKKRQKKITHLKQSECGCEG